MIGHTSSTIYDNAIRLVLESTLESPLFIFRPFCTWKEGARELLYKDKVISTIGANNAGAIGAIQGKTMSLAYCDEMTLYPDAIIDMISTRLSRPYSKLIATMNPSHPTHKMKGWIDKAINGDKDYYQLKFTLEDNPFVDDNYKNRIKNSLSGVFYKRFYLGEWTLAEGAIFDFFDRKVNVVDRVPRAADYWIAGVDYGTNNAFAAVLIGINRGINIQDRPIWWVEKEFYWDHKVKGRQKTSGEFADDLQQLIEPYGVRHVYIDPSAASFKVDLQRRGIHAINADNDVGNGIVRMTSLLKGDIKYGQLYIHSDCKNLIREVESYVWDSKKAERGIDEPLKKDDHAIDALRYAVNTHKVSRFDQEAHNRQHEQWLKERYFRDGRGF